MSTSQGGAGSGEQQSGSIQDMVREMELGGEDIKALGEAEMEQVGEGGYGEVFLIKSNKFKDKIVKKMIPEYELEWEMFDMEVEAMVATRHIDGVVSIVGWWRGASSCLIVMEYGGRTDLEQLLTEEVTGQQKNDIAGQLLNAVMLLHDEGGYTHNDIAVSNVMVDFHRQGDESMPNKNVSSVDVRLIDFGLARRNEEIRDKDGIVISTERSPFPHTNRQAYWDPIALYTCNGYKMGEPRIAGNQNGAWSDVYAAALCVAQLFGTKTQSQHSAHGLLYDFGEGCFAGAEGLKRVIEKLTALDPLERWGMDEIACSQWFQRWCSTTSYTGKKMKARTKPKSQYQVDWKGKIFEIMPEEPVAQVDFTVAASPFTSSSQVSPQLPLLSRSVITAAGVMVSAEQQSIALLNTESANAFNGDVPASTVASPMGTAGISKVAKKGQEIPRKQNAAAGDFPQAQGSSALPGERGSSDEAMIAFGFAGDSASTPRRDYPGETRERVIQQSVDVLVNEAGGTASAVAGVLAGAGVAASKKRERDVAGAGTSGGAREGHVKGARVVGAASKRGRAKGGASAGRSRKLGMTLRSESQAKPTADAQTLGPSTRSMTLRDREAKSMRSEAKGKRPNAATSTRGKASGNRTARTQTAATRVSVRIATVSKTAKREEGGTTAATARESKSKRRRNEDAAVGEDEVDNGGEGGEGGGGGSGSTGKRVIKKAKRAGTQSKDGANSQRKATGAPN